MKIIRSFRRSISITVQENKEVVVRAPYFLSMSKINEFVKSKEEWIKKQQDKQEKLIEKSNNYNFLENVYVNGEKFDFSKIKENDKRITKASFYTKKFYDLVINRAEKTAKLWGFKANFRLCNSKCIWGSCNEKKIIKLNWKLVILPENIQNYVICHELAHIKQMNHSKKFWNEVEKLDKNYKNDRKLLKEYSFLLREQVIS